jgi:hypothetical protein
MMSLVVLRAKRSDCRPSSLHLQLPSAVGNTIFGLSSKTALFGPPLKSCLEHAKLSWHARVNGSGLASRSAENFFEMLPTLPKISTAFAIKHTFAHVCP